MEGEEGLVAIVEGLQSSGLTITVTSNRAQSLLEGRAQREYDVLRNRNVHIVSSSCQPPLAASEPGEMGQLRALGQLETLMSQMAQRGRERHEGRAKTAEQAKTMARAERSCMTTNNYAHAVYDTYTSSYQKAFSHVTPTSPEVLLPEYPARVDGPGPCQRGSHFAVGVPRCRGNLTCDRSCAPCSDGRNALGSCSVPSAREETQRIINYDQRYQHTPHPSGRPCRDKDEACFVSSLRHYPAESMDAIHSSDLLQQLIAYNQNNNWPKDSSFSRSLRSIRNRHRPKERSHKIVQTYMKHITSPECSEHLNLTPSARQMDSPGSESPRRSRSPRRYCSKSPSPNRSSAPRCDSPRYSMSPTRLATLRPRVTSRRPVASGRCATPRRSGPPSWFTSPMRSKSPSQRSKFANKTRQPPMEDSPYFTQQNPYSCDSKGKVREQQSVGDNQPSTSYDYLNGARFGNRSTEIRYLNEVSKYVTDTLRQICEQPVTPPLCSQLQKRYLNHRKSCSRGNVNLDKWSLVSMDRKVQCGIEPCAMTSTSCGSENIRRRSYSSSPTRKLALNDTCSPMNILQFNDSDNSCLCIEDINHKIDRIILRWLHCIPVIAVCSFSDRCMKAKSIKCLMANLKVLMANNDIEAAKAEIIKRLSSLPLWYPYDPDTFKAELAEELLNELKNLKKVKNVALAEWLRCVPLWDSDEERQNFSNNLEMSYEELKTKGLSEIEIQNRMVRTISGIIGNLLEIQGKNMELSEKNRLVDDIWEKLLDSIDAKKGDVVNMFEKKIAEWIQDVPMLIAKTSGQKKQTEKFVKTLATNLAKLSDLPVKEREKGFQDAIISRFDDLLDERGQDMTSEAKEKIIAKLMQSVISDLPRPEIANPVQEEMLKTLAKAGLVPITSTEKKEFDRITKNSAKQTEKLKTQGKCDEEIEELLRDNYNNAVEEILKCKGESLNSKGKKQLVETLIKQCLKAANGVDKVSKGGKDVKDPIRNYSGNVLNFLNAVPELDDMSSADKKDLSAKIAKRTAQLAEKGYTNEDIAKRLQSEFEDLLGDLKLEVNPEIFENLVNSVVETEKSSADKPIRNRRKSGGSLSEMRNYSGNVLNFLNAVPELDNISSADKKDLSAKIAKRTAQLAEKGYTNEEIAKRLQSEFEDLLGDLELEVKPEIFENLVNSVVETEKSSADKPIRNRGKRGGSLSETRNYSGNVLNFLNAVPELDNISSADKKDLSAKIAKRTAQLAEKGYTNEDIAKRLQSEFENLFGDLELEMNPETFENLVNSVVETEKSSADKPLRNRGKSGGSLSETRNYSGKVLNFLNAVPELDNISSVDKKDLSAKIAKKTAQLAEKGYTNEEIAKRLQSEFEDLLGDLELEVKPEIFENLVNSVVETEKSSADKPIRNRGNSGGSLSEARNYSENVLNFLNAVPELDNISSADKKDLSAKIAKRTAQLAEKGYTNEDIAKRLQSEFENLFGDLELEMNPETFENLVNSVVETEKSSADKPRRNRGQSEESLSEMEDGAISNIQKDLVKAFEAIPELASTTPQEKKEVEKICKSLAKKGQKLITENLSGDVIKEKLTEDMIDAVDTILKDKPGKKLDLKSKMEIVDQLFNEVVTSVNKLKRRKKSNDSVRAIDDIPELTSSTPAENKRLEEVNKEVAKRVEQLRAENYTDEEIKDKLKEEFGDKISDMHLPINSETSDDGTGGPNKRVSIIGQRKQKIDQETANKAEDKVKGQSTSSVENELPKKESSPKGTDNTFTAHMAKSLKSKLDELRNRKISNEKTKIIMLAETREELDKILEQRSEFLDENVKNHLAEVLLIRLLKSQRKQKNNETPNTLGDLVKILGEYSIHSSDYIKRKIIRSLKHNIIALEKSKAYKSTECKDQLKVHAMHEINKLLEDHFETLPFAAKEKIVLNLVDEVCKNYEKEKQERAEQLNFEVDDTQSSSESFDDSDNKRKQSVNKQVAAWFRSTQYKPGNTTGQRIFTKVSQNSKRIKKGNLSSGESRTHIVRKLRFFSEDVAEVTGERVDVKQKDKLIQRLLTGSNINIRKEMDDDPILVSSSKDQKPLSRKLSVHSNCNLKCSDRDKNKLSIDDIEGTSRCSKHKKNQNKDTDSIKISEYDYNGRRIRRREVEPKYIVTGKIKSNAKQKHFVPLISTENIVKATSKMNGEVHTKKSTPLAQKRSKQDVINRTPNEFECESIISEEEIAKLFDDIIHYEIFKKGKKESKEKGVWYDVFILSPSEDEILQYKLEPSEIHRANEKKFQENAEEKEKSFNKEKAANKCTMFCTETSDIEEPMEKVDDQVGVPKINLTPKKTPHKRKQWIPAICDKKYSRTNINKLPEILKTQVFISDELLRRQVTRSSSEQCPAENTSMSPKGRRFEDRSKEKSQLRYKTKDAGAATKPRKTSFVDKPTSSKEGTQLPTNLPRRDSNTSNTKNRKSENEQEDRESIHVENRLHDLLVEEAGVTGPEAQSLAHNVLQRSLRPESAENFMTLEYLDEILTDHIKKILNEGPVTDNRDYLERNLGELLADEIKRGTVNVNTKNKIGEILEQGRVPNELIDKTLQTLYDTTYKISERVKKLNEREKNGKKVKLPEKNDYDYRCFKEIEKFLTPITADINDQEKLKQKNDIKDAVATLKEILMNTSSHDEQDNQMLPVLLNLIKKNPLTIDTPAEVLAKQLLENLEKIHLTASTTPRQSIQSQETGEFKLAESEYLTKIQNEIEKWLSGLSIDPGIANDSNFKKAFIKDLAGNVVDRQKYYQVHSANKPSAKEQLEHLNYDVFRLMNKFLESKDLEIAMSSIDELMNAIRSINVPSLIVGASPTYTDALANEIAAYIDKMPPGYLGVDRSKLRNAIKDLVDEIDEAKYKPDVDSKISEAISTWLPKIFPKVPRTELNKMGKQLKQILKEKGFTDDSWILSLDPSKFLEENLNSALVDWLKSTPLYLNKKQQEKNDMENAVNVLSDGLKQEIKRVLNSQELGNLDIDAVLLEEIKKHLCHVIRDPRLTDPSFMHEAAEVILGYLKDQQMFQNISQRTNGPGEYLEAVVANWVQSIPVQGSNSVEEKQLDDAEKEFIRRLKQARLQHHPNSPQHEKHVKEEVKRFLQSIITDSCVKFDENFLNDKAEDLVRVLKIVPIDHVRPNVEACPERTDVSRSFKSPADILYDDVASWCQDLPIYCGDSPDDMEKVQLIKQNLSCKLINKIGALNLNPEIFKDDFLYEEILLDELDIMLKDVPKSSDFIKYLPALKSLLVAKVKEARQTIRNELDAMNYKHQLREAIDATINFPGGLTSEEFANFEIFKDTISEAFINYLYSPNNDDIKSAVAKKISHEVDKLCNDYVRHRGLGCCYDTDKIKADIYNALQSVNMPSDESMKSEVEQLKIKNVINNWLKLIPFRDDTAAGRLNRNKVTTILAKRIHELEKEKESNPYYDSYSNILDEIVKYLKKMPLVPGAESAIQYLADRLKNTLQSSAQIRKFDSQKCINSIHSESVCFKNSSSLTAADREHMQRIKERTGKISFCKDTCVGPPPLHECSQTDVIRPSLNQTICPNKSMGIQCSSLFTPSAYSSRPPNCIAPKTPCHALPPQATINLSSQNKSMGTQCSSSFTPSAHSSRLPDWMAPQTPYTLPSQDTANRSDYPCPNAKSFVSTASSPLSRSPPCASSTRYSCMAARPSSSRQCSHTLRDSSINRASAEISPNVIIKEYVWEETSPSQSTPTSPNPQDVSQNRTTTKSPGVPLLGSFQSCGCGPGRRRSISDWKPCTFSEESSGDEFRPGSSHMCKPRVINLVSCNEPPQPSHPYSTARPKPKKAKTKHKPRSDDSLSIVEGRQPEYCETCYKHRGNPCSERLEERSRCSCKEKVFVSCKGNSNIVREHCQRCGATCPHPTNLYFRK